MSYSSNQDKIIQEFIDYYGIENIPNPDHYPIRFKFFVKSFIHRSKIEEFNEVQVNENSQ